MRVLVTAGPTREHMDAVRFMTNASTGMMGALVAYVADSRGHDVVLVVGPCEGEFVADTVPRTRVIRVVSAQDMLDACQAEWPTCDALVATAAVCDFRFAVRHEGKPEKPAGTLTIDLVPTVDVLATLAAEKGARRVVGFAMQVEDADHRAREKLHRKRCDMIVLNSPAAMGAQKADFVMIPKDGPSRRMDGASKSDVAKAIVEFLEASST